MNKLLFIILFGLNISAFSQIKNDLSTPQKSWDLFLTALKTGQSDAVKKVVTENGFQSLIKSVSPSSNDDKNPFAATFQVWGDMWSKMELNWGSIKGNKVILTIKSEDNTKIFNFLKVNSEWKMDYWN